MLKYTCTVDIDLPIATTAALWENEDCFHEWQDGFKKIEHLTGTPNSVGATSRIYFEGKRKFELLETIISANLPAEKKGLYQHTHMTNTQTTRFEKLGENKTRYISEVEYTKFNGFIIKGMAALFPGKFRQQSLKWMHQFKAFAERKK